MGGEEKWLIIEELLTDISTDLEWIRMLLYLKNRELFKKEIRTNKQLKEIINGT
jgi:hypothetical protein